MNEPGISTAFETAHARVCELIRRFQRYARDNYLQPGYQEAEARKAFIDPMLKALGRERRTVAALSETSWSPQSRRLSQVDLVSVTRGEINQTIYRKFITNNPGHKRLVKGVEIARYQVRERLSQGQQEWLDESAFLKVNSPREVIHRKRIATQRITGVDERLRIVCTIIPQSAYFADSTNSIVVADDTPVSIKYVRRSRWSRARHELARLPVHAAAPRGPSRHRDVVPRRRSARGRGRGS